MSSGSASQGLYVDYDFDGSYIEWNVNIDTAGTYLISFRYALDAGPRPLSIFVNTNEIPWDPTNPTASFINTAWTPTQFPLQRCEGDCDEDSDCSDGLGENYYSRMIFLQNIFSL